jgi:hypothetical protein
MIRVAPDAACGALSKRPGWRAERAIDVAAIMDIVAP